MSPVVRTTQEQKIREKWKTVQIETRRGRTEGGKGLMHQRPPTAENLDLEIRSLLSRNKVERFHTFSNSLLLARDMENVVNMSYGCNPPGLHTHIGKILTHWWEVESELSVGAHQPQSVLRIECARRSFVKVVKKLQEQHRHWENLHEIQVHPIEVRFRPSELVPYVCSPNSAHVVQTWPYAPPTDFRAHWFIHSFRLMALQDNKKPTPKWVMSKMNKKLKNSQTPKRFLTQTDGERNKISAPQWR